MVKAEYLDSLATEKYGRRKAKATDIQALKTWLFYYLIVQKRVSTTSTVYDLITTT